MGSVLNWSHAPQEIGEEPLRVCRSAVENERLALACALEIPACEAVDVEYEVRALTRGRYLVRGAIHARLVQSCVVTLEPVEQEFEDRFEVEFWPEAQIPQTREVEVAASPEVEPIEGGRIAVGRVVYEQIAAGLDLYPRKEGAAFSWPEQFPAAEQTPEEGPFAVLGKLKRRS